MQKKPNVVIITLDECKASAMSSYGNPYVDMKGCKYAESNGAMFQNSFTTHPKCVPSRSALLSGRYPHTGGHRTLPGFELRQDENNLAGILKQNGYITGMFGKNHTVEDCAIDLYFDEYKKEYYSQEKKKAKDKTLYKDSMKKAFYMDRWDEIFDDENEDFYDTEDAIKFIEKNRDKEFFALVNLSLPHPVYYEMPGYIEKIREKNVLPPDIEKLEECTEILKMYRQTYDVEDLSYDQRKTIYEAYLSMVWYADDLAKKIYDKIEALGLKDNTIIVYTSDHGDFAGEHGCYEKYDTLFYDCLVKVPLFIQYPELIKPQKLGSMIENVDILPTLLDMLGIKKPHSIHGKSALPYISGEKQNHKGYVFCEGGVEEYSVMNAPHYDSDLCSRMLPNYYLKQKVMIDNPKTMQRAKMIRTKKWKLVFREDGKKELYDMVNDPKEMENVADGHKNIVYELMERLLIWEIETEPDTPHIDNLYA